MKVGLSPILDFVAGMTVIKYNRKQRKKAIRKIQKDKLWSNQQWRRAHPRKKIKGGKPKGKQNKQNLEPVRKVKVAA